MDSVKELVEIGKFDVNSIVLRRRSLLQGGHFLEQRVAKARCQRQQECRGNADGSLHDDLREGVKWDAREIMNW